MTILIVPSWYKTDSNQILGSFFREQAMMINENGEKVIVADATFQGRADYFSKRCFKLQKYNDEGIRTYSFVTPGFGAFKSENGGYIRFYKNLKKIYKAIISDGYKIDLIHAHSYLPAGIAAVRLGEEENIPVIITEHASNVLEKQLSAKRKEILKEVVRKSNEFICVSKSLKQSVIELTDGIKEPVVIPNAVNKRFVYLEKKNNDEFVFISIGNLVRSKRFDLTIAAFAAAFKGNFQIKLKILGDGILRAELENLCKDYGVNQQVSFLGRVGREKVIQELQGANVFLLPSDFETFGVVYIEALACGLPVIGTKNGGAQEIIEKNIGLLVEKNSVDELSCAVRNIYENYKDYDLSKIAENCQKKFGESEIIKKLFEIYDRALNDSEK